jgi:hypothetical protein
MTSLAMKDPDSSAAGFTDRTLEPLRYDGQGSDPPEPTGIILSMISLGARVLDVGCGTGSISSLIRDMDCHRARSADSFSKGSKRFAACSKDLSPFPLRPIYLYLARSPRFKK